MDHRKLYRRDTPITATDRHRLLEDVGEPYTEVIDPTSIEGRTLILHNPLKARARRKHRMDPKINTPGAFLPTSELPTIPGGPAAIRRSSTRLERRCGACQGCYAAADGHLVPCDKEAPTEPAPAPEVSTAERFPSLMSQLSEVGEPYEKLPSDDADATWPASFAPPKMDE